MGSVLFIRDTLELGVDCVSLDPCGRTKWVAAVFATLCLWQSPLDRQSPRRIRGVTENFVASKANACLIRAQTSPLLHFPLPRGPRQSLSNLSLPTTGNTSVPIQKPPP